MNHYVGGRRAFVIIALGIVSVGLAVASPGSAETTSATANSEPRPVSEMTPAERAERAKALAARLDESAPSLGGFAAQSTSGCADNTSCMWYKDDFEGSKRQVDGSYVGDWYYYADYYTWLSAKNRFANRFFKSRFVAGDPDRCLDAGENKEQFSKIMSEFKVGAVGRTCADAN